MTYKKIYSVNVCAYILMITKTKPITQRDDNGVVYFLFPDDSTTNFLLNTYRNTNPIVGLKDLTAAYREIRNLIRGCK